MGASLESMLRAVSHSREPDSRAPREVFKRLQLVAGLLRAESTPGGGPRLLWRDARGDVTALGVTRPLVIGRGSECDLVLASPRVSRRHCVVRPGEAAVEVEDLGSSNGTRVNGVAVRQRTLREGDLIEVGGVALVFAS